MAQAVPPGTGPIAPSDATPSVPAAGQQTSDYLSPVPALRALPVEPGTENQNPAHPNLTNAGGNSTDASLLNKWYTISVSLRGTYDSNIGTTQNASGGVRYGTTLDATLLGSRTLGAHSISGGYTFDLTYYPDDTLSNSGLPGGNTSSLQFNHLLNLQDTYVYSERLTIVLQDNATYGIEPNIYQNAGTPFNNGDHLTNLFAASGSYQLSPIIGINVAYSNTVAYYLDQAVAQTQNNIQQSITGSGSVTVLPSLSASAGGFVDAATYTEADRGYVEYTLFGGANWQINPNLTVSGRLGASLTQPVLGESTISPYASLNGSWTTGGRSHVTFNYSHEISPSSQPNAQASEADDASVGFQYDFNSRITGSLLASVTRSVVTGGFVSGQVSRNELEYTIGPALAYHYNSYLDFDCGVSLSGNQSDDATRQYTRDTAYIGVRGTY